MYLHTYVLHTLRVDAVVTCIIIWPEFLFKSSAPLLSMLPKKEVFHFKRSINEQYINITYLCKNLELILAESTKRDN